MTLAAVSVLGHGQTHSKEQIEDEEAHKAELSREAKSQELEKETASDAGTLTQPAQVTEPII